MGKRILIVEDDPNLRKVLYFTFHSRGYDTAVAEDGAGALDIAQTFKPDVAVIDLGLPDMSGHELGLKLKQLPDLQEIKLFALTGSDRPEDFKESEKAGFIRHVVKPPDLDEIESFF